MMKTLTVKAEISNIAAVIDFLEKELRIMDCPDADRIKIDVAADEILANISGYAYGDGTGNATVTIMPLEGNRGAEISFVDSGMEFNPLEKEDPELIADSEKRKIGGLGIFIVKKTMDKTVYERKDGRNILTITKLFNQEV